MLIHLGSTTVVFHRDIVGIFDLDYCSTGKRTREYLAKAQRSGQIVNVSEELPKSFIVCNEGGKTVVYISPISTATLRKRAEIQTEL